MANKAILFCPSGGQWYTCSQGNRFVGCCASDPCVSTCPRGDLYPMAFDSDYFGTFPDASCGTNSLFYVCSLDGWNAMAGCCESNACSQGGCPTGDLTAAFMGSEEQRKFYGNVSGINPKATPITTGLVARISHAPASKSYVSDVERLGRTQGLTSVGISIAIMTICFTSLALWLCYRNIVRLPRNKQRSCEPEREVFTTDDAMPGKDDSPPESPSTVRPWTDLTRLGLRSLYICGLTTLIELCLCGFLNFLWYAGATNRTWNNIMVSGWATRSIAVTALILRSAVDVQAALGFAIIAALFLESSVGVQLHQAAGFSAMRAAGTGPWSFVWFVLDGARLSTFHHRSFNGIYIIGGLLVVTSGLLQFASTILLSDLSTGPLVSGASAVIIQPDLSYLATLSNGTTGIPRGSAWTNNPPSYASFGEYHEPIQDQEDGVADTGLTLRAFLPYALADTRQRISSYSGNTFVMDSRVSCQAPSLENLQGAFWDGEREAPYRATNDTKTTVSISHIQLSGWVAPTKKSAMLNNSTPIPFNCTVAGSATTVCQLQKADREARDSVKSQFENSAIFGTSFLLLRGEQRSQQSGPWANFTVTHTSQSPDREKKITVEVIQTLEASATMCFAPWNSAILRVVLSSKTNRTEPQLKYVIDDFTSYGNGGFRTREVLDHLMPSTDTKTRQILAMEKPRSYLGDLPPPYRRPIIQSDISGSFIAQTDKPLPGNWSVVLSGTPLANTLINFEVPPYQLVGADPAIAAIFNDAHEAASVEWALSSVITVLSMTNYYGQLPAFDRVDNVTISNFEDVLYPRDHLGLTLLMWALTAHLIVVAILVVLFVLKTRLTLLGNTWSAFLQLAESPEVMEHMEGARGMTDSEVLKRLKEAKKDGSRAKIVRQGEEAEVTVN